MSIPVNLSPLGMVGTGILPVGYLAADFLEFTGTQYMRFPVAVNNDFGLYFDATKVEISEVNNFPISWQRSNPFSAFRISVNASYGAILWWNAGTLQHNAPSSSRRLWQGNFKNSRMLRVEGDGHSVEKPITVDITANYDEVCFGKLMVIEEKTLHQPAAFKAFAIKMSQGAGVVYDLVPCVNKNGVPGLYDCVGKCCYQNQGAGQFIVGMTLDQARKLSKLPNTGGTLTVSLPWEAQLVQHNAEVEAALEVARSKGWLMKVQYRDAEADSAVYNKYATCARVADMQAVNADYKHDLTADGEWLYPLDGLTNGYMLFYNGNLKGAQRFYFPKLTAGNDMFANNSGESLITEVEIDAPIVTSIRELFLSNNKSALRKVTLFTPNGKDWLRLCLRNPNLAEFWSDAENLVDASEAFSDCVLNKESVLRICSVNLGETSSGKITLGIHVDHQTDAEVLAAIEAAEAKGWTVTVQWNGTAGTSTASTYGLRRQPIYAKCGNMELPDGTSERVLDWGHYVTKWEENGYLEFASVEEAREYFNIEETEL